MYNVDQSIRKKPYQFIKRAIDQLCNCDNKVIVEIGSMRKGCDHDLDDYNHFCKTLGVLTQDDFYKHERLLLEELGFKNKYDYYASLRKAEVRDKKIDSIINPE
jgi:hypothetical protein